MLKTEPISSDFQVAISGCSGLIGSALGKQLIGSGYRVRPLVRREPSEETSATRVENEINWSPQSGLYDPNELNRVGCVVHLAGRSIASGRWTSAEKKRISSSRIDATQRLVQQICQLDSPPQIFICASAIGIYGDHGQDIVDENTPPASDFLAEVARHWEEACQPLASKGVRVVHARFGIVLSSQGGALAKAMPIFRWCLGGRLGSGQQFWSWIGLSDCVRALMWLITNPDAQQAYNLVSPQPVTNAEFTQILSRVLRVPAFVPAPAWALRMIAGEMADALLLTSSRVVPARLTQQGFTFEQPDLETFLRAELGG